MTDNSSPYDWPIGAFGAGPLFERSHRAYRWVLAQYETHLWTFRLSPDVEYRLRKAVEDSVVVPMVPLDDDDRPEAHTTLWGIPVEVDSALPPDTILLRRERSF